MNKNIISALAGISLAFSLPVMAQESPDNQVILSFHTNIYDNVGAENAFHFELGATEPVYVDVDCGYGLTEMEVGVAGFNNGELQGSVFSGSVSAAGNVTVYGDPSKIDYVMLEGLYMSTLDCSNLTNVEILNIKYNDLESLDLSHMTKLMALYADGNPFDKSPLVVGGNKPNLAIMSLSMIDNLDPNFNLSDYPELQSFVAYSTHSLLKANTSNCPKLVQLSIDGAAVSEVDFTNNPALRIINLSETRVTSVDLSPCYNLSQFYATHQASHNGDYKLKSIDVSKNPNLQYLFLTGNLLESLDLSENTVLTDLYVGDNYLTEIDVTPLTRLINLHVEKNLLTFNNLPAPSNSYLDYVYAPRPMQVDRSYQEGTVIDFSDKVLRKNTTTLGALYTFKATAPSELIPVDASAYTYADGKITLKQALPDSAVAVFMNSLFPDAIMQTTPFMIKTAETFGKPSAAATLRFAANESALSISVGIAGATAAQPKPFYVDFGNGVLTRFEATTDGVPESPNATGTRAGTVTVYTSEGDDLTALSVQNQRLLNADVSASRALHTLALVNCQLPSIVLQWNRLLKDLDLSGNKLTALSLRGINDLFVKNMLRNINLSNNSLASIDAEVPNGWYTLNVAHNKLTTLPFSQLKSLTELNISDNLFTEILVNDTEVLEVLDASDNLLTSIIIPNYLPLKEVNLSGNKFTFAALPPANSYDKYTYAPQKSVVLPAEAPMVSLADYLHAADGTVTEFTWVSATTNAKLPDGAVTGSDGRFTFNDLNVGQIVCRMTNAAFPDFKDNNALTTTPVQPAEMPKNVWAKFKTLQDGTGQITMTGTANGNVVYVDWGKGNLEPYILYTQVAHFPAEVTAGAEVTCYSMTEDPGLYGVSLGVGELGSADFSSLTNLKYFSLVGAKIGQDNVKMPESPDLAELRLENCGFTDFSALAQKYPKLKMMSVTRNNFKKIDISNLKNMEAFYASHCDLEEFTSSNPKLWNLDLMSNNLKTLDLSNLPKLDQLYISENAFETIDLSAAPLLRVVYLDANRFTFATLPADANYNIYCYTNQAPIAVEAHDGVIDLSSQLKVGETETSYKWFVGIPSVDSEGNVSGEPLPEDYYELVDGVTTFKKDAFGVICVMQNAVFPGLYLTTELLDITAQSVADIVAPAASAARVNGNSIVVTAADGTPVAVADLSGRTVATATGSATFGPLTAGIYIAKVGADTFKLIVK